MCLYNKTLSSKLSRPAEGTRILTRCLGIALLLLGVVLPSLPPRVHASPLDLEDVTPQEILLAQRSIADSTAHQDMHPGTVVDDQSPILDETHHVSSGRAFLYNLMLAEKRGAKKFVNKYTELMEEWRQAVDARGADLRDWDRKRYLARS